MYPWIWRHLPGPTLIRVFMVMALFAALVVVLFTVVFPWIEPRLPFTDVTVDTTSSGSSG